MVPSLQDVRKTDPARNETVVGEHLKFERKDVWDMKWADVSKENEQGCEKAEVMKLVRKQQAGMIWRLVFSKQWMVALLRFVCVSLFFLFFSDV